tara:strand:+ start:1335 stop:2027 length:693 start_codon:yes stop_codon:yes gene_type:complete
MSRSRDLANLANNATGLETLTVSDITDLTATATELNYVSGAGSALQTQINSKIGGSNPTLTLGSNTTFASGNIVKTYYAEYTESNSTTYSIQTWHDIPNLSITTDVPKSTSSKFLLFGHTVHGTNEDWSAKFRFYNVTTSSAVSNATTRAQGSEQFSNFIGGHTYPNSSADMFNGNGQGYQSSNNGSAQTFKLQGYSGRNGYILNRQWANNNDDISGNACICSLIVMEIA